MKTLVPMHAAILQPSLRVLQGTVETGQKSPLKGQRIPSASPKAQTVSSSGLEKIALFKSGHLFA
jgi:hypothetical protein